MKMKIGTSRKLRYGGVTAALTAAIIAIVIIVNVMFSALADKFLWYTDLTPELSFTLSENFIDLMKNGDDSFVPLVAYKILYDLSERSNESIWNLYLMADESIIDTIVGALELNEDAELAKAFKFLHSNAGGDYERTEKFLSDNRKYIQTKMVKYVKSNIDRF